MATGNPDSTQAHKPVRVEGRTKADWISNRDTGDYWIYRGERRFGLAVGLTLGETRTRSLR